MSFRHIRFIFSIISILTVLIYSGCKHPTSGISSSDDDTEYYAVIPETTIQADSTTVSSLISVSPDSSVLSFSSGSDQLENLEAGDVLSMGVSSLTPGGLLRKVETINRTAGTVIVTTSQASIDEAIQEGHVGFTRSLTTGDLSSNALAAGIELTDFPRTVVPRSINLSLINREILPGVIVNGEISFDMDLEFALDIDWFSLEKCTFIIHTDYDSDLEFDISDDAEVSEIMEVGTLSFPPIVIPAGIQLVFVPELSLNVGIDGTVSSGVNARVIQTASLDAGLIYDGEWNEVKDFSSSFQYFTPEIDSAVDMKGFIGPELSIKLYDIIGPYANAYGYLKLNAEMVDSEPWWELHGGLDFGTGVEIEILSDNATIADYGKPDLIEYDRLLLSGTGSQAHNWQLQTVDDYTIDDLIANTSSDVFVEPNGEIHIAYGFEGPDSDDDNKLKYAHYDGEFWTTELVDSNTMMRAFPSIAVGSDGKVYISYNRDAGDAQLALATRTPSGWTIETVDTDSPYVSNLWNPSSLVLDSSGNPHVAYSAYTDLGSDQLIKYAFRDGSGWHSEIINPGEADNGKCNSPVLRLTSDGKPCIAYCDRDIWYAFKDDTAWHLEDAGMINIINCRIGFDLDSNDTPHIAYRDPSDDIRYRYKTAGGWSDNLVDNSNFYSGHLDFSLDDSDIPHIVYHDFDNDNIRHAVWQGSGWGIGVIDETSADIGTFNSIFILGDTSYVSYYDAENKRLRLAQWTGDQG